jgi:hypothetical protein
MQAILIAAQANLLEGQVKVRSTGRRHNRLSLALRSMSVDMQAILIAAQANLLEGQVKVRSYGEGNCLEQFNTMG